MAEKVPGARGRWWAWLPWAAMASLGVLVVAHLASPDGRHGTATYLTALCGSAALAVIAAVRLGPPRRARALLAAGIACSALADVIWEMYLTIDGDSPDVSVADVFWLGSYVFVAAALWMARDRGARLRDDPDAVIDVGVVAVITSLVVWYLWVGPTLSDSSTSLGVRLVWATYPVFDAALLTMLASLVVGRARRPAGTGFVAAGLACWLLADLGNLALGTDTSLSPVMDVGWMLGSGALAVGVWRLAPASTVEEPVAPFTDSGADQIPRVGPGRVALAIAPLLVPWAFELVAYARGTDTDPVPLFVATAALALLVFLRTVHLVRLGRASNARLAASERLYRAVASHTSDAALVLDRHGVLQKPSPGLDALLQTPVASEVGTDVVALAERAGEFGADMRRLWDKSLANPGRDIEDTFCVHPRGSPPKWVAVRVVNLLADPEVEAVIANLSDVTDRKRAEDALAHQAFHDTLTGLPNRALFRDRLDHALEGAERTDQRPVLLYVDLDGFKHVNDSLGHDAGDELLIEVGRRMTGLVRSGDTIARLGGDEFAILVERTSNPLLEARMVASRLLQALVPPVDILGQSITVSASIGIAPATESSSAASLLRDADTAMYRAKTTGRSRWVEYEPTMRAAAVQRLQIESDLHAALEADQLRLEYQPVVDLDDGTVVGFEALLRWTHPTLGELTPGLFVPIAEESGLIVEVGRWVLDTACHQAARWHRRFGSSPSMAVNVSARQLIAPELYDHVQAALESSGLDPTSLVLEITETALIDDGAVAVAVLERLRRLGIRLAVDDFGTGYSSLTHLRQFPVDIIKIDRSFVSIIGSDEETPDIVRGLLELAKTLHLRTVAEGIESDDQLQQLRRLRCDEGQGFLFARSLAAPVAEHLLAQRAVIEAHHPHPNGQAEESAVTRRR